MYRFSRLLIAVACLLATTTKAQTIPNAGFETWSTLGPFLYPDGWEPGPGLHRSTTTHSGTYALQCVVDTFTNPMTSMLDTVVPNAYTGAPVMGPPPMGSSFGGYAFTSRPDSLTGFYQFQTTAGDSFRIQVTLSHWDSTTHSRVSLAQGVFSSNVVATSYTRFSFPLQYTGSGLPDTCLIQILPANPMAPRHKGTSLLVDDLAFAKAQTAVGDVSAYNYLSVYPNPLTDEIHVTLQGNQTLESITISDLSGRVLVSGKINEINTRLLPPATYLVAIKTTDGVVRTTKIVKE